MRLLPLYLTLVVLGASLASFVTLLETPTAGWEILALGRAAGVGVLLLVVIALLVERRPTRRAPQVQIPIAITSLAFAIVAILKLYGHSSPGTTLGQALTWSGEAQVFAFGALTLGLLGTRARSREATVGTAVAATICLGCTAYAISLASNPKAAAWYAVAEIAAVLAAGGAARGRMGSHR